MTGVRRVAVLADTHLHREPSPSSPWLRAAAEADLVLHAGDLASVAALEALERLGVPLVAVHGNVDEPEVRRLLPERVTVELEHVSVGLVHDAGPARGRLDRLRVWFPGTVAVVFGHSHVPLHETGADGFQIFNPGSPTQRRGQPHHMMGRAEVLPDGIAFRHVVL